MIDALRTAFAEIHTIPEEILELAFDNVHMDVSLDERIRREVINKRVRNDTSIFAGPLFEFVIQADWGKYTELPSIYALGVSGTYSAFRIPPEARDHRDISCVVDVSFPYTIANGGVTNYYTDCNNGGNTLSNLACAALRAQTGAGIIANPRGKVHPGNVITLEPKMISFVPWRVTVRLEFDENFSGMEVSALRPFALLCRYAVQAYIYSKLIVKVESNMVYRGVTLGSVRDIVSSFQDSNEKYEEQMLQFRGGSAYDTDRLTKILQHCIPRA